jgi:metal-sulfur cluster biosynthetic enzyme
MDMLESALIDDQIRAVLAQIYDPCSIAAGRPISLIDMGLVRGWTLENGTLSIIFCVTFAGCTMAPHFAQAAANDLANIPGINRVETHIDTDFVWTPDRMIDVPTILTGKPQAWRDRISP